MISDIRNHVSHYSLLALIVVVFTGLFIRFLHDNTMLFAIMVVFAMAYVLWGMLHHFYSRNLRCKVMLEYVLIATVAIMLASTLLI